MLDEGHAEEEAYRKTVAWYHLMWGFAFIIAAVPLFILQALDDDTHSVAGLSATETKDGFVIQGVVLMQNGLVSVMCYILCFCFPLSTRSASRVCVGNLLWSYLSTLLSLLLVEGLRSVGVIACLLAETLTVVVFGTTAAASATSASTTAVLVYVTIVEYARPSVLDDALHTGIVYTAANANANATNPAGASGAAVAAHFSSRRLLYTHPILTLAALFTCGLIFRSALSRSQRVLPASEARVVHVEGRPHSEKYSPKASPTLDRSLDSIPHRDTSAFLDNEDSDLQPPEHLSRTVSQRRQGPELSCHVEEQVISPAVPQAASPNNPNTRVVTMSSPKGRFGRMGRCRALSRGCTPCTSCGAADTPYCPFTGERHLNVERDSHFSIIVGGSTTDRDSASPLPVPVPMHHSPTRDAHEYLGLDAGVAEMKSPGASTDVLRSKRVRSSSGINQASSVQMIKKTMRWKKGALLGQGGFGKVHLGLNLDTGELMAVKHVEFSLADKDIRKKLEQLRMEIRIMEPLDHTHIVKYFFTEMVGNSVNVFMEYVPGGSLLALMQTFGHLSEEIAVQYTYQILMGLAHLHSQGIVHHDVKCANVLLTVEGVVKLADFGASAIIEQKVCDPKGTPYWMAPEVIKAEAHGWEADIWSLGCTVMEMLTGDHPWAHLHLSHMETLATLCNEECPVTPPTTITAASQMFITDCLKKNAEERPSATALIDHHYFLEDVEEMVRTVEGSIRGLQSRGSKSSELDTLETNSDSESTGAQVRPRFLAQASSASISSLASHGSTSTRATIHSYLDKRHSLLMKIKKNTQGRTGKAIVRTSTKATLQDEGCFGDVAVASETGGFDDTIRSSVVEGYAPPPPFTAPPRSPVNAAAGKPRVVRASKSGSVV